MCSGGSDGDRGGGGAGDDDGGGGGGGGGGDGEVGGGTAVVDIEIHHSGCRRVDGNVPGNMNFPRTLPSTKRAAGW